MDINEKKEKILNQEISIADLSLEEVEQIKELVQRDLKNKKQELNDVNQRIKEVKIKIDNWNQ